MSNYDYTELLSEIERQKISQRQLADLAGMKPSTLSEKLNGKTDFKVSEMHSIATALKLKKLEKYFLCEKS